MVEALNVIRRALQMLSELKRSVWWWTSSDDHGVVIECAAELRGAAFQPPLSSTNHGRMNARQRRLLPAAPAIHARPIALQRAGAFGH